MRMRHICAADARRRAGTGDAPQPRARPAKKVKGELHYTAKIRSVRQELAEEVLAMLQEDTSEYAVGACEADLRWMAEAATVGDCNEAPANTQAQLASNWKHWLAFCARFRIDSPMRPDIAGLDAAGLRREKTIWSAALVWIYSHSMKPARGKYLQDGRPKPVSPQSAMAVLRGVKRIHTEAGVETPTLNLAAKRLLELMRAYARDVGPENVAPQRKAPLTHDLIVGMLSVPDGTKLPGAASTWEWTSVYGRSCRTAIHVLAQCGFRKAEIALASGTKFDSMRLSFANLTWWLDGGTRETATPETSELLSLRKGDYCGLIPPPSKADQFGAKWANNTIWLPFDPDAAINAARALA